LMLAIRLLLSRKADSFFNAFSRVTLDVEE
jgi:hypothetical protein